MVNDESKINKCRETFPLISHTADCEILFDNLSLEILNNIEDILSACVSGKIELYVPRDKNDEPDFFGDFDLIINDEQYIENGYELLVLKWIDDFECTDYLIDCMR